MPALRSAGGVRHGMARACTSYQARISAARSRNVYASICLVLLVWPAIGLKVALDMKQPRHTSTTRGFSRAASLMQTRIRKASESRGFAQARLLTHWSEIVGETTAAIATPVKVAYAKSGLGATLTVLTTGAQAPMLEMQKEQIREKVNACYGYRAIAAVRITQTAPTGFHDGRAAFGHAPKVKAGPDAACQSQASDISKEVQSDDLRAALAALGANVISKTKS